ncbi:MAG TPA: hypothetical protein VE888_14800 [Streptosporangiaceae bacterium]|nr:hypothetical protein [Streptosporangiaceae bacterium]
MTVILLIVGHRPVFQTGPGEELLCPPQTAPRHLSGFTRHDDGVYFGNSARLVHLCHCISGESGGTIPNEVPVPRELFIARPAAEAGTLYPEPCLTVFLLTRAP